MKKNDLNISNKQLASQVEVSESLISKIFSGKRMTRDNLIKLAIVLEFSLVEINQLMRYYNFPTLYVKDSRDQMYLTWFI